MTPFEDQAPNFTPYIVTLTWTVGDSLEVNCGDLEGWEVLALLQQAEEVIREAERTDQDAEGEDADA
jgi:hypothetical protein